MRVRALFAFLITGVVLAACGSVSSGVTATKARDNGVVAPPNSTGNQTPDTTSPDTTTPGTDSTDPDNTSPDNTTFDTQAPGTTIAVPANQDVINFGDAKTPRDYDGFLISAFKDIEAFWAEQFPATFGGDFEPLSGGIFAAYEARTTRIPGCDSPQTTYKDVEGNAFYCPDGDFIVYDDDFLLPQLVKSLGESSVGVVLAHEFGHAIQARINELNEQTILKEQQADCFAGAWSAHVARGEADGLSFGDKELKQGLIAMIQVRDPIDGSASVNDPNAHGTGFDRVGAFQDGFTGGTARCKTFFTEDRTKDLIDIPFDPDNPTGNLPFDNGTTGGDIKTLMPKDLDRFWVQKLGGISGVTFTAPTLQLYSLDATLPKCEGVDEAGFKANQIFYCESSNSILVDQDLAEQLDADELFGDMSVGYLIGEAYSEAVQQALHSTLTGKKRVLLNDCFTGAWVADDIPPLPADRPVEDSIKLSAGDLDEAIITALKRSDDSDGTNKRGTAFEKIAAFRNGVLDGIDACRQQIS